MRHSCFKELMIATASTCVFFSTSFLNLLTEHDLEKKGPTYILYVRKYTHVCMAICLYIMESYVSGDNTEGYD